MSINGNGFLSHALTAIISASLASFGSVMVARYEKDGVMTVAGYERMAKLESDVARLTEKNGKLQIKLAMVNAQMQYGPDVKPLDVVFNLIEDIQTPAWCKTWEPPAMAGGDSGKFIMAYINSDYELEYGVSSALYVGKTDYEIHKPAIADQFFKNDFEVLVKRKFIDFQERINTADGKRVTRRFWKFWHRPRESKTELVCGWEVP